MEFPFSFVPVGAEQTFRKYLLPLCDTEIHCLQIGAFTGDATTFLLDHVLLDKSSTLTDVDTWTGSGLSEEAHFDWTNTEREYDERHSAAMATGRLIKRKMTSNEFFRKNDNEFDFIYVDGNRIGPAVLQDGMNAVRCLKPMGLLAFNDAVFHQKKTAIPGPSPAISALLQVFTDELTVLETNNLVWIRRH